MPYFSLEQRGTTPATGLAKTTIHLPHTTRAASDRQANMNCFALAGCQPAHRQWECRGCPFCLQWLAFLPQKNTRRGQSQSLDNLRWNTSSCHHRDNVTAAPQPRNDTCLDRCQPLLCRKCDYNERKACNGLTVKTSPVNLVAPREGTNSAPS